MHEIFTGKLKVIKDNLFDPPEIFKIIQQNSSADDKEMYQVFNMGCRLEIYTDEATAAQMIEKLHNLILKQKLLVMQRKAIKKNCC